VAVGIVAGIAAAAVGPIEAAVVGIHSRVAAAEVAGSRTGALYVSVMTAC
jgi:hypothetical protein